MAFKPSALNKSLKELQQIQKVLSKALDQFVIETWVDEESLSQNIAKPNLDKKLVGVHKRLVKLSNVIEHQQRKL